MSVSALLYVRHATGFDPGAIAFRLVAQTSQDGCTRDALESWVVVAFRNERRTAFPGVDHRKRSTVSGEIDRGGESRGTTADDEAIEHEAATLLDRGRHLGGGHQRLRKLHQQLVGIRLLAKRLCQVLYDSTVMELLGQIARSRIPGHLIMLDPLRGA